MAEERLQKVLARAGIASRRAAEELITKGRVKVDGRLVDQLGVRVDPRRAKIEVDGNRLMAEPLAYVVLHKPRGVMCTLSDPEGRPTVAELLRAVGVRVVPVGRLDFHTSGALLCTNDGDFANALAHPRNKAKKVYVAKVQGLVQDDQLLDWRKSIEIDGRATAPAEVRRLRFEGDKTWLELTLREGRNRQVRRLGEATGSLVMRLARISHAGVTAENLRPGQWRHLSLDELVALKREFGVPHRVRNPGTEAWEIQIKANDRVPRGPVAKRSTTKPRAQREDTRREDPRREDTRREDPRREDGVVHGKPRSSATRFAQKDRPVRGERADARPTRGTGSERSHACPAPGTGRDRNNARPAPGTGRDRNSARPAPGTGRDRNNARPAPGTGRDRNSARSAPERGNARPVRAESPRPAKAERSAQQAPERVGRAETRPTRDARTNSRDGRASSRRRGT
jgi:23S rRNA pseudouridine2605 synthase